MLMLNCHKCGKLFPKGIHRSNYLYCHDCRNGKDKSYREHYEGKGRAIATATVGATHELLVCAYLMRRGFNVFRSQSPSCPCDIVAMKDGEFFRIEVTTGYRGVNGVTFPYHAPDKYDILACVFHDDTMVFYDNKKQSYTFPAS